MDFMKFFQKQRGYFLIFFIFYFFSSHSFALSSIANQASIYTLKESSSTCPLITSNGKGKAIAVWYSHLNPSTGLGSLHAALLDCPQKDRLDQKLFTLHASSEALIPLKMHEQAVGMDENGNAIIAWTINKNYIQTSRFDAKSETWSNFHTPLSKPSNNLSCPSVAVAKNGNAIVLWSQTDDFSHYQIIANTYDASTGQWKGEKIIYKGPLIVEAFHNPLTIDNSGNAIVTFLSSPLSIQLAKLDFKMNAWNIMSFSAAVPITSIIGILDNQGNITLISQHNTSLWAANILQNQPSVMHRISLSENANFLFSFPSAKVDPDGNVIVAWADNSGLGSAIYSINSNSWNVLPVLNLNGPVPADTRFSIDPSGNIAAAWTVFDWSGGDIQTAFLDKERSFWIPASDLKTALKTTTRCRNPQVCFISPLSILTLWENDTDSLLTGSINIATISYEVPVQITTITHKESK